MNVNDTRQQMIITAIRLFQRDGYHATTWRKVVKEAGTPWGSIAHHFPGGKVELACAAIEFGAVWVNQLIKNCFATEKTCTEAIKTWFSKTGESMRSAEFQAGCPVASIALTTSPQVDALDVASRLAFEQWEQTLCQEMRLAGYNSEGLDDIAKVILTLLEGGIVHARISRSCRALDLAGETAATYLVNTHLSSTPL